MLPSVGRALNGRQLFLCLHGRPTAAAGRDRRHARWAHFSLLKRIAETDLTVSVALLGSVLCSS